MDYNNNGRAYVFEKPASGWTNMTETAKLKYSTIVSGQSFGYSISIFNDNIIVGASGKSHDDPSGTIGVAYLFHKPLSGWTDTTETQIIRAPIGEYDYNFGIDVDIENDIIVIGACGDVYNSTYCGAVYIYEINQNCTDIICKAKLTNSNGLGADYFGNKVAISNNCVVAGAQRLNSTGVAYVFEKPVTGWTDTIESYTLTAMYCNFNDEFGNSVGISENNILIGNNRHDINTISNTGAVYNYVKNISNVEKHKNNQNLTVYYNQTSDEIIIKSDISTPKKLSIVNLSGTNILSKTVFEKNQTINISNLKKGMYLIYIQTNNDTFVRKIVK
jgi:hypothetical protein